MFVFIHQSISCYLRILLTCSVTFGSGLNAMKNKRAFVLAKNPNNIVLIINIQNVSGNKIYH